MAVVVVPFDQLSRRSGALRGADPTRDEILMVRSAEMIASRRWGAQRLFFVLSAAAQLAKALRDDGFTVTELAAPNVIAGIKRFGKEHPDASLIATEPRSRRMRRDFADAGVELVPDDSFLTPVSEYAKWGQDSIPLMETFYRKQRIRLDLLMDGAEPLGGRWNFDAENRLPPPKQPHVWPEPLHHELDDLDRAVWSGLVAERADLLGAAPDGTWATTRAGALAQLEHFVEFALAEFGPYEDAMPADSWSVNHSLLSPYLNIGLLDPDEVVQSAMQRYAAGGVELSSIEGFVRQIIGWREFINAVYWSVDEEYAERNALNADLPLPPAFDDPSKTQMRCVSSTLEDVHQRGWVHHIPRLMILGNLALIAGIQPKHILEWMRRMFVDAADWVMEPNVIGMALYADGGMMTTKPYAGGGAYIKKMSRHCAACPFDPGKRTGEDACPFTTLYWDFLNRHRASFSRNPRLSKQLGGYARLSDAEEIPARAALVRERLAAGTL